MVVDCGGGTVDVTVHKLHHARGPLKELYKASGEPCGSLGQSSHIKTKKYSTSLVLKSQKYQLQCSLVAD